MPAGGARPNSGRKKGRAQTVSNQAREEAAAAGLLPHEWLLKVARGEPIPHKQWKIIYDKKGNELSRELVEVEVYAERFSDQGKYLKVTEARLTYVAIDADGRPRPVPVHS